MEEKDNYCPSCGAVARPYPPPVTYHYQGRSERKTILIVIIVVALVIVLPVLLSAVMYIMVVGVGQTTPITPSAVLSIETSGDVMNISVLAVSHRTELNSVWLRIHAAAEEGGMMAGEGTSLGMGFTQRTFETVIMTYLDLDGDRCLSKDDRMVISSRSGPLASGPYSLDMMFMPHGAVIGHVETVVA